MIRLDLREPSDFFDFSHDPWEVRLIDKYEISSRLALILLQSGLCAAQGLLFISIDWQWLIGPLVVNLVYLAGAIVNFSMMVSMFEAITNVIHHFSILIFLAWPTLVTLDKASHHNCKLGEKAEDFWTILYPGLKAYLFCGFLIFLTYAQHHLFRDLHYLNKYSREIKNENEVKKMIETQTVVMPEKEISS